MSSRDRTREILDVKERGDRSSSWSGPYRLQYLQHQWLKNRSDKACVPDFYVIRAVTLLEVFTRRNLAELIDEDRRFTDKAIDLSKHVKIDFALIRDIQGRAITLGDILAHSVPVNSFGQIFGYFETIIGKPLRPLVENAVDPWDATIDKGPIITDFDDLSRCLSRLFEVRHILCHEAPQASVYEATEIDKFLETAISFAKAMYEVLTFEKFGKVPLTQTEMNIAAGEELKKSEQEMNDMLSRVEARVTEFDNDYPPVEVPDRSHSDRSWLSHLKDAQNKWLAYRNAQCEFHTFLNRGGAICSMIWGHEAKRLTDLRISDLASWLKRDDEQ